MIIAGIDPGKTGAMVTLFEDGSTIIDRVPKLSGPSKGKDKAGRPKPGKVNPDWIEWGRRWRSSILFNAPDVFVIENVHGWKGQAAGASFSFGKAMGFALATAMCIDVPIHYAPPNVWKIKLGLASLDKEASVELARQLIPSLIPALLPVRGNPVDARAGVAEAGLLAYYGKLTIAG